MPRLRSGHFCHWGRRRALTPLYFACGGSDFPVVAGELLGSARADGLQSAGALRPGGAASDSRRSAARGRLQLPVGSLLPGQARLRAGVRAASGGCGRGPRHHGQRRAAGRRTSRSRSRTCAASRGSRSTPQSPRYRRPLARASRDARASARTDARSCCWARSRAESTWTSSGSLRRAAALPADFVGRGDMSRGGLMLRRAREGRELDYRPVLGAVRHGPRPPKLPPEAPVNAAAAQPPATTTPRSALAPSLSTRESGPGEGAVEATLQLPRDADDVELRLGGRAVRLTNLNKLFWPELGITKRRPAPVLRRRLARAPAAPPRPRDGHEALPARRRGRVLLHEARPVAAAGLDRDLLDRARLGQRHRLSDGPGPGRRCSGSSTSAAST